MTINPDVILWIEAALLKHKVALRVGPSQLAHKVGPKWGRSGFYMGMWGPYLSHIAHMGPIWYLRGVMWVCGAHVFPT